MTESIGATNTILHQTREEAKQLATADINSVKQESDRIRGQIVWHCQLIIQEINSANSKVLTNKLDKIS